MCHRYPCQDQRVNIHVLHVKKGNCIVLNDNTTVVMHSVVCRSVHGRWINHALTQTLRQRVPPVAVLLTHTRRVAHQLHALMTPENDAAAQASTGLNIFQPPVVQEARQSAVYFCQMERHMQSTSTGSPDGKPFSSQHNLIIANFNMLNVS